MAERVLVTGTNGFVGKAVYNRLLEAGYAVRAGIDDSGQWPTLKAVIQQLYELRNLILLGGLSCFLCDISSGRAARRADWKPMRVRQFGAYLGCFWDEQFNSRDSGMVHG